MRLTNFTICFDNPGCVFLAGEHISGTIKVGFGKPTKLKSIKVILDGKAKSKWVVQHGKSSTTYSAKEHYIEQTIIVYGGVGEVTHPEGNFIYPFSCPTGPEIPSSYEGRKGYVRYTCTALIHRSYGSGCSILEPFTVIHHLDCNQFLNALTPIHDQRNEEIQGCCCEEGNIVLDLTINKTAFVPGEPLVYEIDINNMSENTVGQINLLLRQESVFTGYSNNLFSSGKPHYHTKKEYFTMYQGFVDIQKNTSRKIGGAATIPALVPSLLEGCNIINIHYYIVLNVPSGWSTIKVRKEIIIGTKPAIALQPVLVPPPAREATPVSPSEIELSTFPSREPSAPPVSNDLPPSYAECVFGAVDMRDDDDEGQTTSQRNWAPAYTYYNWEQQNYSGPAPQQMRPAPPSYDEL